MPTEALPLKPALVCRPALPVDTPAVLDLTARIWDGGDYVPRVWDDWLADPLGLLAVGEYAGKVVATGKLTRLLPRSWWLEGLRVHPDYEGRGFASRIFAYLHGYWLRHCDGVIRLVTHSDNQPVQRMCNRLGYQRIAEFTPFRAPILSLDSAAHLNPASLFVQLGEHQVEQAVQIAQACDSLAFSRGLIDLGWTWVDLNAHHLAGAARLGRLYSWRGGQGILSAWPEVDDGPTAPYLMLAACPAERLGEMLTDYRRFSGQQGYAQAGWSAPLHPGLLPILEQAGFSRYWQEGSVVIYEFVHPTSVV